jgi:4-hydroxybenzoate polyprenyltransferase
MTIVIERRHTVFTNIILSLRPKQWGKNLLVFAGLLFGHRLFDIHAVLDAFGAFFVFCALSGVVYILNDIVDHDRDRLHPIKMRRPIASDALPVPIAKTAAVVILIIGMVGAVIIGPLFSWTVVSYLLLQAAYSLTLKHVVILDALAIAIGFVLRAVGGAVAVDVEISHWLLVCTILLALFIAFAKRRHELELLANGAARHRAILTEYSSYLLDQMIGVTTSSTLVSYIFYTISPETQLKFGTAWLGLTIPLPIYGIFRYLYLVHQRHSGGDPTELLLTDRPLLACVVLWALMVAVIIYHK